MPRLSPDTLLLILLSGCTTTETPVSIGDSIAEASDAGIEAAPETESDLTETKVEKKSLSPEDVEYRRQLIIERHTRRKNVDPSYPTCIDAEVVSEGNDSFVVNCADGYMVIQVSCPAADPKSCLIHVQDKMRMPYGQPGR